MGLDIGVGDGTSFLPLQDEPRIALENDGYFWFLSPLIERLAGETGELIDLYEDAAFEGESLNSLERMLAEARRLIEEQPETWSQQIGFEVHQQRPHRRDIDCTVDREIFLKLLDDWNGIIERARQLDRTVVCFGD